MIKPITSDFNPDPSICAGEDGYFMVTSSFEYYLGISIYYSKNLLDWTLINYALRSELELLSYSNVSDSYGIFAPTIRKYQDQYYIFCTFVNPSSKVVNYNFFIKSKDPFTRWSDPIKLNFDGIALLLYS